MQILLALTKGLVRGEELVYEREWGTVKVFRLDHPYVLYGLSCSLKGDAPFGAYFLMAGPASDSPHRFGLYPLPAPATGPEGPVLDWTAPDAPAPLVGSHGETYVDFEEQATLTELCNVLLRVLANQLDLFRWLDAN
jgi:hypothetical protein